MARTVSQTINLQVPDQISKYITEITDNGIKGYKRNKYFI